MKRGMLFETAIDRLELIVNKLESGEESLENTLKLFEEGTKIASFCYSTLDNAQQKIVQLSKIEEKRGLNIEDE